MAVSINSPIPLELALAIRLAHVLDINVHVYTNEAHDIQSFEVIYHNGERDSFGTINELYDSLNAMAQAKKALAL